MFDVRPFEVEEVDPTGAGDCFDGAFISGLVKGMDIKEAAVYDSAAGASAVTKKGPMEGAAWLYDIDRLVKDNIK